MPESYTDVLTAAINDIIEHGFDSQDRIAYWQERLRRAAEEGLNSTAQMDRDMRASLGQLYDRLIGRGQVVRYHPGVARFTIDRLAPELRAALNRRILGAADLIKLNRAEAIRKTLQRFSGWATSVPVGGAAEPDRRDIKRVVRKSLAGLPYEERRLATDQGHKLTSSLNAVIAEGGDAIAGVWHSHWRQSGYQFRPDHKERDEQVYLIRGNWAQSEGLVKPGSAGYTNQITQPGEEVFCRCFYAYVYHLRQLPDDMLTEKGRQALAEAKAKAMAMA